MLFVASEDFIHQKTLLILFLFTQKKDTHGTSCYAGIHFNTANYSRLIYTRYINPLVEVCLVAALMEKPNTVFQALWVPVSHFSCSGHW